MIQRQPFESSIKKPLSKKIIQEIQFKQPQAESIRQYLNIKRTAKDKSCLCIFLLYLSMSTIILGIAFFYGNYGSIGAVLSSKSTNVTECPVFVTQTYTNCVSACNVTNQIYLQKVCLQNITNIQFSSTLKSQISIYNLKYCFNYIVVISAVLMAVTIVFYSLIICLPKIIYLYIVLMFMALLGLSFYLLKFVEDRKIQYPTQISPGTIFSQDESQIGIVAYLLLSIYLVIFPFVLFTPDKLKFATKILTVLNKYFRKTLTIFTFTIILIVFVWALLILQAFLVMSMFTSGTPTINSTSFLYLYEGIYLYNPAVLVLHFIGAYWIFGTIVSLHKYLISCSMFIWYFNDNDLRKHLRMSLRKTYKYIGSAAVDAILTPVQWILLILYSILKIQQDTDSEKEGCFMGCLHSIRVWFNKMYFKINRNSSNAAVITNNNYFQGSESAAAAFCINKHRFFNIGGILSLFLTIFCCILWILFAYIVLSALVFAKTFPPPVSSLSLPIVLIFFMALIIGSILTNLFTCSIDCLLFCYLLQKKTAQTQFSGKAQIIKVLDECYLRSTEQQNITIAYQFQFSCMDYQ